MSGLAIIDDHGHLMGTLGSRDVKGLVAQGPLDLTRLRLNTREYINFIKQLSVEVTNHPSSRVITISAHVDVGSPRSPC